MHKGEKSGINPLATETRMNLVDIGHIRSLIGEVFPVPGKPAITGISTIGDEHPAAPYRTLEIDQEVHNRRTVSIDPAYIEGLLIPF